MLSFRNLTIGSSLLADLTALEGADIKSLFSSRQSSSMNKQEIRAAVAVAALFLVRMLGLFMILPVLPLVGEELEQSTPFRVGLALGIYGLSQAFFQIPLGLASDHFSRKSVVTFGLILFTFGSCVAAFGQDIFTVILGRFIQGCGAISSTLLALVSDVTRIDHRSKAMGIVGIAIGLSFGFSIILGPVIFSYQGLSGIFSFSAFLGLIGLIILWKLIPTPISIKTNLDTKVALDKCWLMLSDRTLVPIYSGVFFLHYLLTSGFMVFPLIFRDVGIEDGMHSIYYFGVFLVALFLMSPLVWLSDRPGRSHNVLRGMVCCLIIAMIGLANALSSVVILISMVVFFVGFNLLEVLLPAHMSKIVAAGTRGTGMGIYSTFQFLGTFMGGVSAGLLLSYADIIMLLYANAGIGVVWLVMCFKLQSLDGIQSRVVHLKAFEGKPEKLLLEQLLSLNGVLDAVLIYEERIAYLKVQNDLFDDSQLQEFITNKI